jgi:hypothetical protein
MKKLIKVTAAVVQSYGFTPPPDDDATKSVLSSLKVAAKSE